VTTWVGMDSHQTRLQRSPGKNRRPDRWRDVQQLQGEIGHYIISDRPMSEEQWIRERTLIEAKPNTSFSGASQR
jgi:hypothetical protein